MLLFLIFVHMIFIDMKCLEINAYLCTVYLKLVHKKWFDMPRYASSNYVPISSPQFSSVSQSCLMHCNPMDYSMAGFPVHLQLQNLLNLMSVELVMPSNILSSVVSFSSRLQSSPATGSFQMSQFFASGGHSIGISASASVPPMNTQDWFPLGLTGWISLQSKGLPRVFPDSTVQKHKFFGAQLSL